MSLHMIWSRSTLLRWNQKGFTCLTKKYTPTGAEVTSVPRHRIIPTPLMGRKVRSREGLPPPSFPADWAKWDSCRVLACPHRESGGGGQKCARVANARKRGVTRNVHQKQIPPFPKGAPGDLHSASYKDQSPPPSFQSYKPTNKCPKLPQSHVLSSELIKINY